MKKKLFNIFFCLIMSFIVLNIKPYHNNCIYAYASELDDLINETKDEAAIEAEKNLELDKLTWFQPFIYRTFSDGGVGKLLTPVVRDLTIQDFEFDIIKNIYKALLPFALGLTLIYMIIDLIDKASHLGGRNFDEKFYFVALAKLIIAEWLLVKGLDIFYLIIKLNNAFLELLQTIPLTSITTSAQTSTTSNYQVLYDAVKALSLGEQFCLVIPSLLLYLMNGICSIVLRFQSISKKFEIILMGCFSSVAMGGVFTDFSRGTAVKYIKKFMACTLHAASIVLILRLATILSGSSLITYFADASAFNKVLTGSLNLIAMPLLYPFAAIGSISLAKSIINDAFGS